MGRLFFFVKTPFWGFSDPCKDHTLHSQLFQCFIVISNFQFPICDKSDKSKVTIISSSASIIEAVANYKAGCRDIVVVQLE